MHFQYTIVEISAKSCLIFFQILLKFSIINEHCQNLFLKILNGLAVEKNYRMLDPKIKSASLRTELQAPFC